MPINEKHIEQFVLIERSEQYTKTAIELLKLKAIDKASTILARSVTSLIIIIPFCFFLMNVSLSLSLWLGSITGKNYYGFMIVAIAHALIGIVLILIFAKIKKRINDRIITEILND